MATIKIKNASDCNKCSRSKCCESKEDYISLVDTMQVIADTYNSLDVKVSFKCKKEC